MFARLTITVFFVQVCKGDWSDRRDNGRFGGGSNNDRQQCSDQWRSHDQCMKNRQSDYSGVSDLSSSDRADMKAKARICFRNQGCSDPFVNDADGQAKQRCYVQYRDRMRSDIERCVQRTYPDYSLPAENDAAAQYGQDMINIRNSNCRPRDKRSFVQCLVAARGNQGQSSRRGSQRSDYCSVRYDCYQQARYTQACYDRSARVRDELCRCTRQAPIDTYKDVYVQCLHAAGRPTPDDRQDYNLVALNALENSGGDKKFCSNMSDPCGGFQGRQSTGRDNGGRNRGDGRTNQGSGWNAGRGNNQGWSNSGGGQEEGSGGQNWNQAGGSSSIDTSSSVDTSNFGTSSSSNTDFGSLLSGGGIIPDPSSILGSSTSAGSTSGVGNLGSILGGGFDPSQIFGGNFDLTSMLSNAGTGSGGFLGGLTGGTGGGLLGGGLPDLSSLFGGRKK